MELDTETGEPIENPTDDAIRQTLASLGPQNSFAILTRQEEPPELIQAAVEAGAFSMEFQEKDGHWRCEDEALPLEKAVAILLSYKRGDDAWRKMIAWHDVTDEATGPHWARIALLAVILLIGLAAMLLYLANR